AAQVLPHSLSQSSRAVAMDHANLTAVRQERLIDVAVELVQGRLDALADQVDLRRDLDRLLEVPPAGAEIGPIRPVRPIGPIRPRRPRGRQLLGAATQALPLYQDLGAAGLQLVEH